MHAPALIQRHWFAAGFAVGFGFYLLCGAAALALGQFTPWGGPCTIGAPFGILILGLIAAVFWSLALVGLLILQRAGRFTYGCLTAHGLVLGTLYLLRLVL